MTALDVPVRYEPLSRLGKGGGGEVWAVRDRHTGGRRALKVLSDEATEGEMAALVREAVTLSGLEGLGVPRVLAFGRLPDSRRPFMIRELVDGRSLQELVDERAAPRTCLEALARCADQATLVHRAGLLHGDIKPANVIVKDGGGATLVDLGLAAPWREGGVIAQGLTPKYAAPELLQGKPLTVRAEVYALGIALCDILEAGVAVLEPSIGTLLRDVARRATASDPSERHPSADEFASALRRAAGLPEPDVRARVAGDVWPILGTDSTASRLMHAVLALADGEALCLDGPAGSGRSVLLTRVSWSLGVEGRPLVSIDRELARDATAIRAELGAHRSPRGVTILVDDSDRLSEEAASVILGARRQGARLVVVGEGPVSSGAVRFEVPPLGSHAAAELLRRAVPSLTERLVEQVVAVCAGRPGELRQFVRRVAERAIASERDLEELVQGLDEPTSMLPEDSLGRATVLLDRGRYKEARAALEGKQGDELAVAIAWARLDLGLGDAPSALERLNGVEPLARRAAGPLATAWAVYSGRARIGLGEYAAALELLEPACAEQGALGAEALAYRGLASSYVGDHATARAALDASVARSRAAGCKRIEALAEACLGSLLQRADDTDGARASYERAIAAAQDAGDAGVLATSQLNLAGLLKISGDVAGAIEHFESAVDMGERAGRLATVRQGLLNLSNLDLYLGRLSRARASVEALAAQRSELSRALQAQLLGLEAELAARGGDAAKAAVAYAGCAEAYRELGLSVDAAEARLESVLVAARAERPDVGALAEIVARAEAELSGSSAHRSLLSLSRAAVAWASDDEMLARRELSLALAAAREAGQRDFVWRALEAKSEIEEASGQIVSARRDREEALAILEEIATRLPRDLREVFWNDPRRRKLRSHVVESVGVAATQHAEDVAKGRFDFGSGTSSLATLGSTPLEKRLARILELNAELVGEVNLERLTARVTDHAVDMLRAERGSVLLRGPGGGLTVHASRARFSDESHAEFSKSIAEQVVETGQPVVATNVRMEPSLRSFESVHRLPLESVACVPIQSRSGDAIGALYVETRRGTGAAFERELPTLRAFADQVAIALEIAKLIRENEDRAAELAAANASLERAQAELRELLGDRTAQLRRARQKLRDARDTLYGHFGYQGLVGTSAAMRQVYALIDRVKATDVPVLVTGESGTGKEVAARAIHRASARAEKPFFGLNCAAVPEHLLESELFGHVRGAFTGADRERKGLFREADGGTLLLDEIGEMPPKMQTALLRVLQESKVRPVGGSQEHPVDVRLIFATHRDLDALVKAGKFREDLFYRIHVVEVRLPPLRGRAEDIAPLVDHFLGIFAARYKRERCSVSRDALRRLAGYSWPGNVRQLEHVLLNAWVLCDGPVLEPEDFDMPDGADAASHARGGPRSEASVGDRVENRGGSSQELPADAPRGNGGGGSPRESLSRHRKEERERILEALRASGWNRVQAAKLSGIPRRTFYRRLREYGIL